MKSSGYTIVRFITALLTILIIVGQSYIPKKRLLLHPTQNARIAIDGYSDPTYGNSASWIDQDHFAWRCKMPSLGSVNVQGCGATISWGFVFEDYEKANQPTTLACNHSGSDDVNDESSWRANQKCQLIADSSPPKRVIAKAPCLNSQSDVDGDGFGLEYQELCKIRPSNTSIPFCGTYATETYSNGWGWANDDFCIDTNFAKKNEPSIPLTSDEYFKGIDFSPYEALQLKIHYEGQASHLRVYLRNANPNYTTISDHDTAKFMSLSVLTEDLTTGPLTVKLSDFSVSEWWITKNSVPRELAGLELNNITSLGIDQTSPGLHKVRLERLELTGEWVKVEDLLLTITIFWLVYLVIETILRYYTLRKYTQLTSKEIANLTMHAQKLEAETHALQEQTVTDPLTGIFNRVGISKLADTLLKSIKQNQNIGMMMVDIDHFKQVNDTFGHDIGDNILKAVTNIISSNIRTNDIFGRWGGEEFVIICPQTSTSHLMSLAEKLRRIVDQHPFEPQLELDITISIGVTVFRKGDIFDDAFKRADIALYSAKNERNKVSLQP